LLTYNFQTSEWFTKFQPKNSRKKRTNFGHFHLFKKIVNLKEILRTWIRIHFFPGRIQDPDPHKNEMDPKHWYTIYIYHPLLRTELNITNVFNLIAKDFFSITQLCIRSTKYDNTIYILYIIYMFGWSVCSINVYKSEQIRSKLFVATHIAQSSQGKVYGPQRNWIFATTLHFIIPVYLLPTGVTLWYFKLRLFDLA